VNTLRPSYTVDPEGRFTSFEVAQEAADSHPVLRSHRIAIGLYDRTDGGLTRRVSIETDVSGAVTAVPELLGQARPGLVLINDDDLTYAKIRLGFALHHLGRHADAIACYRRALGLLQEVSDRYEQAHVLTRLGDTHVATSDPQAARDAWQQAQAIFDDLRHPKAKQVCDKIHILEKADR
jgi:tetratricopeptide (TPR) repeat protein